MFESDVCRSSLVQFYTQYKLKNPLTCVYANVAFELAIVGEPDLAVWTAILLGPPLGLGGGSGVVGGGEGGPVAVVGGGGPGHARGRLGGLWATLWGRRLGGGCRRTGVLSVPRTEQLNPARTHCKTHKKLTHTSKNSIIFKRTI